MAVARGGWLGWWDEDGPFAGALTLWAALGFVTTLAIAATPRVELRAEDVPDVPWTRVAVRVPPPPTVVPVNPKAPERATDRPVEGPASPPAARRAEERRDVRASRLLVHLLGSRNGAREDLAARVFDGPGGATAADLKAADGAVTDPAEARRGQGRGPGGPAGLDGIGPVGGGEVAVDVRARLRVEPPKVDDAGPGGAELSAQARHQSRSLSYCYERERKLHPDLEGRLEVAWVVHDGAVEGGAVVVHDSVGSDALAACVTRQVERFRFGTGASGRVTLPIVFVPQ